MPSDARSVRSERASDRRCGIFAGFRAARRTRSGSRKRGVRRLAAPSHPAREHPGFLRGSGHGRRDRAGGARPAAFARARERADGGHRRGLRLLSQRPHAQSHRHRIPARPRHHARGTRPPGRALRPRHQGHGRRPPQRRRALSRAAAPRRQRVSGRSRKRAPDHRDPVRPVQRSARAADRPDHRFCRREGRLGLEHRLPQHRVCHRRFARAGGGDRRFRSPVRHGRARFQPGSRCKGSPMRSLRRTVSMR